MRYRYLCIPFVFFLMAMSQQMTLASGPDCGSGCTPPGGATCTKHTDPTGSFSASNTVICSNNTIIGIAKTSTLSVLTKEDIDKELCPDCTVNYPEDNIPESGIKWFETGGGTLTDNSGSTGTWNAPNAPENDMGIILKFDDEGRYANDGGLIQAASILIDAKVPTSETSSDVGDFTTAQCQALGFTYGRGDDYDVALVAPCGVSFSGLTMTEISVQKTSDTCNPAFPTPEIGSTTINASNHWAGNDQIRWCGNINRSSCDVILKVDLGLGPAQYNYADSKPEFHVPAGGLNSLTTNRNMW